MDQIGVTVLGFGNVGNFVVKALANAPDMELKGVVELPSKINYLQESYPKITFVDDIAKLNNVQVAILTVPSNMVSKIAPAILNKGINTVDAYDIHGDKTSNLRNQLNTVGIQCGAVSVIGAGWDPGTDSMIRAVFEIMAPEGITYTNFGPGMSMGHTVAAKSVPGVKNALSLTVPKGLGFHKRLVYIEVDNHMNKAEIVNRVKKDPYFASDETLVIPINNVEKLLDYGHSVSMERKGVASQAHNQRFSYSASITNPAVTAQVMVAAARASTKQTSGCFAVLEIPLIDFLPDCDKEQIIKQIV